MFFLSIKPYKVIIRSVYKPYLINRKGIEDDLLTTTFRGNSANSRTLRRFQNKKFKNKLTQRLVIT